MGTHRFQCPNCNSVLAVNDSAAGRKGSCPKCGQRLQLPAPPDPLPSPAVEEVSAKGPAPLSTKASKPASWQRFAQALLLPKIPRRYLLVTTLMLGVLLALGSFWLFFWRDSPSRVLVSTIMRANAGDYSAAEKCLLPATQTALNSKIEAQLIWAASRRRALSRTSLC